MPNHITNYIIPVTSDDKLKEEFFNALRGENGAIDFNSVIKMPDELKDTIAGSDSVVPDREYEKAVKERKELAYEGMPISESMQKDYMERFGASDWYEWSILNWSTKWNAYEIDTGEYHIRFDTAWSTPLGVFKALSEKFPDLKFYVFYADEDLGSNCGVVTCLGGEVRGQDISEDKALVEAFAILIKHI